jgi:hypothetical protein
MTFLGGVNESLKVVLAEATGLFYRQPVGRTYILLTQNLNRKNIRKEILK